jgi:hypothetical protein
LLEELAMMDIGCTLTIPHLSKLDVKMAVKLLHFPADEIAKDILKRVEDRSSTRYQRAQGRRAGPDGIGE